jgi:Fe-S-cluster containining protein
MSNELPLLNCDGCCACCTNVGHPHFYRFATGEKADQHWANLPQHLREEVNQYVDGLESDDLGQPCIWLDRETNQCKHYEHRPQMCRDFEMNSFHCRRLRKSQGFE